jgi:hypothetical protein
LQKQCGEGVVFRAEALPEAVLRLGGGRSTWEESRNIDADGKEVIGNNKRKTKERDIRKD